MADFSGANNKNAVISNERRSMMRNNCNEGSATISNERYETLCKSFDRGNTIVTNERHSFCKANLMKEVRQSHNI